MSVKLSAEVILERVRKMYYLRKELGLFIKTIQDAILETIPDPLESKESFKTRIYLNFEGIGKCYLQFSASDTYTRRIDITLALTYTDDVNDTILNIFKLNFNELTILHSQFDKILETVLEKYPGTKIYLEGLCK